MLKYLYPSKMDKDEIIGILKENPQIKFVSLVAVDLGNNSTDEKIPISLFIEDYDKFMESGVQTDGSSVNLPLIATINDAQVDLIPDRSVKWIVDYNLDNDFNTLNIRDNRKIGTLLIPALLRHKGLFVDSRSVLKRAEENLKKTSLKILKDNNNFKKFGIEKFEDIEEINITSATELEFWVQTPEEIANIEELMTSQILKEQYWKKTIGPVRTCLENSLIELESYGYEPEMGHKEVGGVKSRTRNGIEQSHIIEQLEVSWKYDNPMQTCDNELFGRHLISNIFSRKNLDVSFNAKPIENVAGNGEHHHIGMSLKLKNKKIINLFSPIDMNKNFMSQIGYGSLMGILKNYEIINPFVSASTDAFNRLKPGFEAPVCTVASIGKRPDEISRNRSVLIGVLKDINNPLATRFELRAPNPKSNSYLTLAACFQAMIEGIEYAINKEMDELHLEMTKLAGTRADYLEEDRQYISEENIYEEYTKDQRDKLFGKAPRNVYEVIKIMEDNKDKIRVLTKNQVFTDKIINSYISVIRDIWINELNNRLIPDNQNIVRSYKKLHDRGHEDVSEQDNKRWEEIRQLRWKLVKHDDYIPGVFDSIKIAIVEKKLDQVSQAQIKMNQDMDILKDLYWQYKHKLLVN